MATSIIERIGLLLRQAEGTDNEAEAQAFTNKAQALASQNAVDLAVARQAIEKREKREEPIQKSILWGSDQGGRNTKAHLVNLFSAIAGPNDVKINIYHDSSGVIVFGFPSDIEVVELLFGSLAIQMVEAGNAYLARGEHKGETTYRSRRVPNPEYDPYGGYGWYREPKTIEEWGHFPIDGRTARANFYRGFSQGVASRLWEVRRATLEAEVVVNDTVTTGALVLADKGQEVGSFYRAKSNARGSWKGSSASHHSGSSSAGNTAGRNARLSGNRAIGGARTGISA